METKDKHHQHTWITTAKERGFGHNLQVMLDAIEPIAPIASQLLLVIQPFASVFGARNVIHDLAHLLDTPEGIETLREQLQDDKTDNLSVK